MLYTKILYCIENYEKPWKSIVPVEESAVYAAAGGVSWRTGIYIYEIEMNMWHFVLSC